MWCAAWAQRPRPPRRRHRRPPPEGPAAPPAPPRVWAPAPLDPAREWCSAPQHWRRWDAAPHHVRVGEVLEQTGKQEAAQPFGRVGRLGGELQRRHAEAHRLGLVKLGDEPVHWTVPPAGQNVEQVPAAATNVDGERGGAGQARGQGRGEPGTRPLRTGGSGPPRRPGRLSTGRAPRSGPQHQRRACAGSRRQAAPPAPRTLRPATGAPRASTTPGPAHTVTALDLERQISARPGRAWGAWQCVPFQSPGQAAPRSIGPCPRRQGAPGPTQFALATGPTPQRPPTRLPGALASRSGHPPPSRPVSTIRGRGDEQEDEGVGGWEART